MLQTAQLSCNLLGRIRWHSGYVHSVRENRTGRRLRHIRFGRNIRVQCLEQNGNRDREGLHRARHLPHQVPRHTDCFEERFKLGEHAVCGALQKVVQVVFREVVLEVRPERVCAGDAHA